MDTELVFEAVNGELRKALGSKPHQVLDAAILGSVSGHYGWQQSCLVDIDAWIYVQDRSSKETLRWVAALGLAVGRSLWNNIAYEIAAIDGPYKPEPLRGKETIFLHLLLDDPGSYPKRSPLTRYSWRKYSPVIEPERLMAMAPAKPSIADLIGSRWGIDDSIAMLSKGYVIMSETDLDTGSQRERQFSPDTFPFREACTYAVMMTARNIGRIDGRSEPDRLANSEFSRWYGVHYSDGFVREVYAVKHATSAGEPDAIDTATLRVRVLDWLLGTREALIRKAKG